MTKKVAIGVQDFRFLIEHGCFYVDKTSFIREWWESLDTVTLLTRPRRFGKTLNMSMLYYFFSNEYAECGDLFAALDIWKEESYRDLQGTWPVLFLSFADVKETDYANARYKICQLLAEQYEKYRFLLDGDLLSESEKKAYLQVGVEMNDAQAGMALRQLSQYLSRCYGKKVIILLDEYDTPMQEAYVNGYWEKLTAFTRSLFNSTFKSNPYLERAILTGITRVSKESIFSDLNNLEVITTTSCKYETAFGFTEKEVQEALAHFGRQGQMDQVKYWYDGFCFGGRAEIYNPWSIIKYLETGKLDTYWANTSSNSLVSKLICEGDTDVKKNFEILMQDGTIFSEMDEQIVYDQLDGNETAIWSLLVASGYLKVMKAEPAPEVPIGKRPSYELKLTNYEVRLMFMSMVRGWFSKVKSDYNDFTRALLQGDPDAMTHYMNRIALSTFSYFDAGNRPSGSEPERFYHGFVLGLLAELSGRYHITSNRESGFGRYDVMLEPLEADDNAIIIEFKVRSSRREKDLGETVAYALHQIDEKGYVQSLMAKGVAPERIRRYGFAFEGKQVLIGMGEDGRAS